jgi:hypothetical protein
MSEKSDRNLILTASARLAGINVGGPAQSERSGDFGLIGLAVMGQNLIMNVADHGFTVIAFNRTVSKVDRFIANEAKGLFLTINSLHLSDSVRKIYHWCSHDPGIRAEAQEASKNDAACHGRKSC